MTVFMFVSSPHLSDSELCVSEQVTAEHSKEDLLQFRVSWNAPSSFVFCIINNNNAIGFI